MNAHPAGMSVHFSTAISQQHNFQQNRSFSILLIPNFIYPNNQNKSPYDIQV